LSIIRDIKRIVLSAFILCLIIPQAHSNGSWYGGSSGSGGGGVSQSYVLNNFLSLAAPNQTVTQTPNFSGGLTSGGNTVLTSVTGLLATGATTGATGQIQPFTLGVSGAGVMLHPSATVVVASSTSRGKAEADYVCTGTNDDVKIQAAVTAIGATGGKIVLLEGIYNISNSIDFSGCGAISLQGAGMSTDWKYNKGTILKLANGVNKPIIVKTEPIWAQDYISPISITNIMIDGNRLSNANSACDGIIFTNVAHSVIRDVGIFRCYNAAIHLKQCYGVTIDNCTLGGCDSSGTHTNGAIIAGTWVPNGYGIYIDSSPDNRISNCYIWHNSIDGIYATTAYDFAATENLVINACSLNWNDGCGVKLIKGTNALWVGRIFNSHLDENGTYGLYVSGNVTNWKIIGCNFFGNQRIAGTDTYAIYMAGTSGYLVQDFDFLGCAFDMYNAQSGTINQNAYVQGVRFLDNNFASGQSGIGIGPDGTVNPTNPLTIKGIAGYNNQIRLYSPYATTGGAFLGGGDNNNFNFAGGAEVYNGSWITHDATPTIVQGDDGAITFYADTGQTPETAYTPTSRMALNSTGLTATVNITAPRLVSNIGIGTAPFVVTSTTQVANLNAATAGTAGNVTGTVAVGNGGTNHTTFTAYMPIAAGTTATGAFQSIATGTQYYPLVYNTSSSLPSFTLLPVAGGGSGVASHTAYMPICGGTTTTGTEQSIATGTQYYPLCYNTSGSLPTFQVLPVAGGGTGATSASITAFNNITGFSAAGTTGTTSTNLVFSTSPVLVTPNIGAATATSVTANSGDLILKGASGGTLKLYANTSDTDYIHINGNNGFTNTTEINYGANNDWYLSYGTTGHVYMRSGANIKFTLAADGSTQLSKYGAGAATFDASGNITSASDERLKNIQGEFKAGLPEILKINPILYKWNKKSGLETEHTYVGFSAQEIKRLIPEAVGQDSKGYLTLNDRGITAALVNAVKEQQKEIDDLKARLDRAGIK
jgi:parallel beta-helix repeat protein